ncbi:glycosyltransferase family 9 protein [Helicobacter japonicus]|uniref:Lipopolysaccharide heptosyltransferase family protein n=3 Tax=Helicobacter japonicus TaxID=425400 RepID=A0A4U8TNU2_9HELI|nr:glycosyltransferase family 9 protein [Helicobacter japonicus]TLE01469.1 lipopolysaccharide heptosyltransferase family protein [Helicobacter japonicus]
MRSLSILHISFTAKAILKKPIYFIIDSIINLLYPTKKARQNKSLVILRNDAIGDYLLFRDFLRVIRKEYSNYHVTLIGNIVFQDIALCLDKTYIDKFIWIDNKKFRKNIVYSILFLAKIQKNKFDIFINPIHSRDINNIIISNKINAIYKFAPSGDNINIDPNIKAQNDRIYTQLFKSSEKIMFEFYRNNEFINHLFQKQIHIEPYINGTLFTKFEAISNYSVLFIGASAEYRKWSIENFAIIGQYLIENYHQNIVICGGKEDMEKAEILESKINAKHKVFNMVGKTSLNALGGIVYNGNLLVSNETSAAHLATILDTTIVIVVSNGNHLGRFIPYPKRLRDKYYPVFHPFIEENFDKYEELSNTYAYQSTLDINEITAKQVIGVIDKIMTKGAANE